MRRAGRTKPRAVELQDRPAAGQRPLGGGPRRPGGVDETEVVLQGKDGPPIRHLDRAATRDRIDAIDRERDALLVLLRAARRAKPERAAAPRKAVRHAD